MDELKIGSSASVKVPGVKAFPVRMECKLRDVLEIGDGKTMLLDVFRSFDPIKTGPRQLYCLLTGAVVPRPIAWVSTMNHQGITNLAPFSFFNVVSVTPPILSITQVFPKPGTDKDTLVSLKETKECVVNFVTSDLAETMNATCKDYPYGVSEIDQLGIPTIESLCVKVPGVAASPIRMECKLRDVLEIGNGKTILLDVMHFAVNDQVLLEDHSIDSAAAVALSRMGRDDYATTHSRFEMPRPPPYE
ncbi:hypothetical protein THRCLA_04536 [Thraustotheca clavata]|uniref:Flavin reductase like domain-containing protein n=1 Tax=Thraustotheca clavata TaxID=74557 RepID=A0A1V9ZYS9_9STRA|nr:hypothetical protein THRCLA_04536 [Thraustotheca clavata]